MMKSEKRMLTLVCSVFHMCSGEIVHQHVHLHIYIVVTVRQMIELKLCVCCVTVDTMTQAYML